MTLDLTDQLASLSDHVAYLLDEIDVDDIRFRFSLGDLGEFVRQAKALHAVTP